jgi:alpha-glucosidase
MNRSRFLQPAEPLNLMLLLVMAAARGLAPAQPEEPPVASRPTIATIDPPESGFYAKRLDYEGIVIKAPTNVVDESLFAARARLSMMLTNLPSARAKLRAAGAELHIIGRDQVTTDLPEWRHDKGKPLAEYHGLTRDQRTRGMGGLLTSCGEENLLKLEKDRYRGRDICVHEFAHSILGHGVSRAVRDKFREQHRRSLERGLWIGSYAGSNYDEFFAELTMWYFGTRGDLGMKDPKPANGPEGLKAYDPEAFGLLDEFYRGKMEPAASESNLPLERPGEPLHPL